MSADNKKQMWIPEGFAHGFLTLSDTAEFLYKTTDFYSADYERSIIWNDRVKFIKFADKFPHMLDKKNDSSRPELNLPRVWYKKSILDNLISSVYD